MKNTDLTAATRRLLPALALMLAATVAQAAPTAAPPAPKPGGVSATAPGAGGRAVAQGISNGLGTLGWPGWPPLWR